PPPGTQYEQSRILADPHVDLRPVDDLHAPDIIDEIRAFSPDLGISLAAPILKPPLFDLPRLGTINLHKGKLPHYRGMPPAVAEIAESQRRFRVNGTDSRARRLCKDALFWGYENVCRPPARRYLAWRNRQRVVVLLYHRVSDELRDSLTVGLEQFERQMAWL